MQVETYKDSDAGERVFSGPATLRLAVKQNSREPAVSMHLICANRNTVGMLTLTKTELEELLVAGNNALAYIASKGVLHA